MLASCRIFFNRSIQFFVLFLLGTLLAIRCYGQYDQRKDKFLILGPSHKVPAGAKYIGKIHVTDKGFKIKCGYNSTLTEAKEKAQKIDGNLIKMTELKRPDAWSTCYRLWADIYSYTDIPGYWQEQATSLDSFVNELYSDTASAALVLIYVPHYLEKKERVEFQVNDSTVHKLKGLWKDEVIVPNAGTTKFSLKGRPDAVINLDVEPGKVYFFRFSRNSINAPTKLQHVDSWEGFHEFFERPVGGEFQRGLVTK